MGLGNSNSSPETCSVSTPTRNTSGNIYVLITQTVNVNEILCLYSEWVVKKGDMKWLETSNNLMAYWVKSCLSTSWRANKSDVKNSLVLTQQWSFMAWSQKLTEIYRTQNKTWSGLFRFTIVPHCCSLLHYFHYHSLGSFMPHKIFWMKTESFTYLQMYIVIIFAQCMFIITGVTNTTQPPCP